MLVDTTVFHASWNSKLERKKMESDEESRGMLNCVGDVGIQREFANYDRFWKYW